MKKYMYKKGFVFLSVLFNLIVCFGCSNDEVKLNSFEKNNLTELFSPIEEGHDYTMIADFYQANYQGGTEYYSFFKDSNKSQCLIINSTNELQSKYMGITPFPSIDFNKYTLFVGQEMMEESFYYILRQELVSHGSNMQLNIYVPMLNGGYSMIQHLFYWGLYPKTHLTNVSVKIIKE